MGMDQIDLTLFGQSQIVLSKEAPIKVLINRTDSKLLLDQKNFI
jgi:hypothetical protein